MSQFLDKKMAVFDSYMVLWTGTSTNCTPRSRENNKSTEAFTKEEENLMCKNGVLSPLTLKALQNVVFDTV